jgi:uncharacterized membrane protein YhaH (DUF805 family)
MTSNLQLVFRGEVIDGFAPEQVRQRIAQALKLDDERVAQLFAGGRTVLKRSLEPALARRYADKLAELGARVHLEPSDAPPTTAFPPLPELPEDSGPTVPPWGTPPRPTRPAPLPPAVSAPAPLALQPVEDITCPTCGENQPKRILCRKCATDMPMGLAAKAEEAARARELRLAELQLRQARRSGAMAAADTSAGWFGLGLEGRMGRLKYATASLLSMALMYMPVIMWLTRPTFGRLALMIVTALLMTLFGMRLAVLRCHDCDKSGWWSLLLWLPTVNVIVTLVLFFAPGSAGSNDYGEEPPPAGWLPFGLALGSVLLLLALTFTSFMRALERAIEENQDDNDAPMTFQADPRAASLPTREQQAAFNEHYLAAPGAKAFAVSPAGGWGHAERRRSVNDAVRGALQECESRRPPYTEACFVVNINGQWASAQ